MADKTKLKVQKRKITGRKVRNLRKDGILPANIYGKDVKSLAVKLPVKDFEKTLKTAGETNIIEISVEKETKTRPVLIHNVHVHPVSDEFLHVDFHQVDLTKKVTVAIPIELVGVAPAVSKGGILLQLLDEIQVEALPNDLPDKFTIDISKLEEIGNSVSVKKLKLSDKVKLISENLDELIVKIEEPTKEEEKPVEEEVPAEGEEGEVKEGEEAKEGETSKEGETPKEGEAKPDKGKSEDKKPDAKAEKK